MKKIILNIIAALTVMTVALPVFGASNPVVLEGNRKRMEKINYYADPQFTEPYIVDKGTPEEITATLNEVKMLSDDLSIGVTDTYEKLRIFNDFVTETIAYDRDAAHNSVAPDVICLKNVLSRKRTTCAGYSNLFSALCNAQGIYCVNIRGAAVGDSTTRANLHEASAPINHEWTAVWYGEEDRWVYVDTTWNSWNKYENGQFRYAEPRLTYFDISEEELSLDHSARIVDFRDFFGVPDSYTEGEAVHPVFAAPAINEYPPIAENSQSLWEGQVTRPPAPHRTAAPQYAVSEASSADAVPSSNDAVGEETVAPGDADQTMPEDGGETVLEPQPRDGTLTDVNGEDAEIEFYGDEIEPAVTAAGSPVLFWVITGGLIVLLAVAGTVVAIKFVRKKDLGNNEEAENTDKEDKQE
jgi:hypothetical protein